MSFIIHVPWTLYEFNAVYPYLIVRKFDADIIESLQVPLWKLVWFQEASEVYIYLLTVKLKCIEYISLELLVIL